MGILLLLLHNFGHSLVGMGVSGGGGGIPNAGVAARCPAPFAFPFTPLGLSLFDIDPSRILSMLHHQTWLAEEALRTRGLLAAPKESPHRFATLSDLLSKEYQTLHHGQHLSAGDMHGTAAITTKQQPTHRSNSQQHMYKQHQQQQQQQPFNIRYPSPAATAAAAFFHHHQQHQHHQQQQQQQQQQHQHQPQDQQKAKQSRQGTPSPLQTATSTQPSWSPKDALLEELKRKSEETVQREECEAEGSSSIANELLSSTHDENGGSTLRGSNSNTPTSSSLYKDSLEQLLQRRRSSSSLGDGLRSATSYSQLLLSASCSTIETSSCKEKSSSSSTSSTPPLTLAPKTATTAALLAQHQHQQQQQQHHQLNHMLKSPSAESSSSLFSETIEEETRCIVCNAHFPNVWLLEQHAALQHPHLGPGEEKPFICEQCGQSYRYRSAYAKHKEQNHRARLPADKLFTCDVCGMQFRYLKSFKKHRLNHALERLHGKKIGPSGLTGARLHMTAGVGGAHMEQDIVTSSQEPNMPVDESGEDLRINIKREQFDEEREEEQDNTIDSVGGGVGSAGSLLLFNDNNSTASTSTEPNISSSDVIHSTNKRPRLLTTPHMETDPSYHHHLQHHQHLAPTHVHVVPSAVHPTHQQPSASTAAAAAAALNSLHSINSITSLINAERIPSEQFLGLNPQEASILNFLRVDAAERQRDKRSPQTSRFACPFCGKCVRSKENLKLHVRKHTGERPFVCLFCGRAFGGKSDLTRHLRIHTGERPYHCESCGKCFARADYLSKHLTTHIHNAPR